MELTWIAIVASLFMGLGAACLFALAVKNDYFRDIEDAKYQVFWSDVEELLNSTTAPVAASKSDEEEEEENGR